MVSWMLKERSFRLPWEAQISTLPWCKWTYPIITRRFYRIEWNLKTCLPSALLDPHSRTSSIDSMLPLHHRLAWCLLEHSIFSRCLWESWILSDLTIWLSASSNNSEKMMTVLMPVQAQWSLTQPKVSMTILDLHSPHVSNSNSNSTTCSK